MNIPQIKHRRITELKTRAFTTQGRYGTEMLYLLDGVPTCSRVWWVMSPEEARMWLHTLP